MIFENFLLFSRFIRLKCTLPLNVNEKRLNGILIADSSNVMIDHVSIAFCCNRLIVLVRSLNITVQNSALMHPRGRAKEEYVSIFTLDDNKNISVMIFLFKNHFEIISFIDSKKFYLSYIRCGQWCKQ